MNQVTIEIDYIRRTKEIIVPYERYTLNHAIRMMINRLEEVNESYRTGDGYVIPLPDRNYNTDSWLLFLHWFGEDNVTIITKNKGYENNIVYSDYTESVFNKTLRPVL